MPRPSHALGAGSLGSPGTASCPGAAAARTGQAAGPARPALAGRPGRSQRASRRRRRTVLAGISPAGAAAPPARTTGPAHGAGTDSRVGGCSHRLAECLSRFRCRTPSSSTPALRHVSSIRRTTPSLLRRSRNSRRCVCEIVSKYFEMSASITHCFPSMAPPPHCVQGVHGRSGPGGTRASKAGNPPRTLAPAASRLLSAPPCPRTWGCPGAASCRPLSGCCAAGPAARSSSRTGSGPEAPTGWPPGPARSPTLSRRRCLPRHPCASAATPPASIRSRCSGAAS